MKEKAETLKDSLKGFKNGILKEIPNLECLKKSEVSNKNLSSLPMQIKNMRSLLRLGTAAMQKKNGRHTVVL